MKKKIGRLVVIGVLCVIIQNIACIEIGANERKEEVYVEKIDVEWSDDIYFKLKSDITIKENIVVGDKQANLYCTFDNQESSLQELKVNAPDLLRVLQSTYDLEEINELNWFDYYNCMFSYLNYDRKENWYSEDNEQFNYAESFFDVYENKKKNEEIIQVLEKMVQDGKTTSEILNDSEFVLRLPDGCEITKWYEKNRKIKKILCEEYFNSTLRGENQQLTKQYSLNSNSANNAKVSVLATSDVSSNVMELTATQISRAVTYANTYAENPNVDGYGYYENGDCANFVSQILAAAGIEQDVYSNENEGWWHKREESGAVYVHSSSRTWRIADDFAKYMGIGYSVKSHSNFSKFIKKGDFITYDKTCDGDWDHMGFVTQVVNSMGNLDYYDYKIAQHTSNYCRYVSDDKNGWEKKAEEGARYAIVRRSVSSERACLK